MSSIFIRSIVPFVSMVLAMTAVNGCRLFQKAPANLLDDGDVAVPIVDGKITLEGFIAGGSTSWVHDEAMHAGYTSCDEVVEKIFAIFDRYRLATAPGKKCGKPTNESPFDRLGYLYVFRPKLLYAVDPGDQVIERTGPEIKGKVAKNHELFAAFTSFNEVCFEEIKAAKERIGGAFIAATCGDAKILKTMVYSQEHNGEVPNLQVVSKLKILLRAGVELEAPATFTLKGSSLVSLPDLAQAIAAVGPNSTEVLVSTFAGSVTKVDLRGGRIIWEKNLTNPSINSVRESTSLNAMATSSDGKWVGVGGDYGYLALLNAANGSKIKMLSCDPRMFMPLHFQAMSFAPDQRSLITAAIRSDYPVGNSSYNHIKFPKKRQSSHTIKITNWDTQGYAARWNVELEAGNVLQVGFSQSQNFVIVATATKVILLSAKDGKLVRSFPLEEYEGPLEGSFISGASFSNDMRLLAISSFSGVSIIDTESSRLVRKLRASLKFELGRPEFISSTNQVRAYDAWGNIYQWDALSGKLLQKGAADGFDLNYNGPATMPILSLAQGKFLVHTQSDFFGSIIMTPREVPSSPYEQICAAGEGADLPALTIRPSARLVVWTVPN